MHCTCPVSFQPTLHAWQSPHARLQAALAAAVAAVASERHLSASDAADVLLPHVLAAISRPQSDEVAPCLPQPCLQSITWKYERHDARGVLGCYQHV